MPGRRGGGMFKWRRRRWRKSSSASVFGRRERQGPGGFGGEESGLAVQWTRYWTAALLESEAIHPSGHSSAYCHPCPQYSASASHRCKLERPRSTNPASSSVPEMADRYSFSLTTFSPRYVDSCAPCAEIVRLLICCSGKLVQIGRF